MYETVKGLVIREVVFGEADKLIDLLTDTGVRTVRVRGARKPGSKYAAVTQIFSYGEFCLRQSSGRLYLDSAVSLSAFYGIRNRLEALALASYFSELVRRTATEQPQPQILRLFLICLHYLSEHTRDDLQIKAVFEMRLVTELGMMPDLVCCPVCLRYLPPKPILRLDKADMVCEDCCPGPGWNDLAVTTATLQAVRHAVFSDLERVLAFRVRGESLLLFAVYAEAYVLRRTEHSYPTLQFYRSLTGMDDDT
ncbi:MAG: DNA repair protein RecO [Oscillospiraceae bacterium]|nr:DNA repair protein RecO [Oscillospiraceae bacterium]